MATQAYRMNSGQLSLPRISPKSSPIRRPPVVLPKTSSRHVAMPIAAMLVEMVARFF
jgi:hypothetical protein